MMTDLISRGFFLTKYNYETDEELLNYICSSLNAKYIAQAFGNKKSVDLCYKEGIHNYLFNKAAIPLHYDDTTMGRPDILVFYCKDSQSEGGELNYLDTNIIYKDLKGENNINLKNFQTYFNFKSLDDKGFISKKRTEPLINKTPLSQKITLNYFPSFKLGNVSFLNQLEGENPRQLQKTIDEKMFNHNSICSHSWEPEDLVLIDNYRTLHGRNHLHLNLKRTILRMQLFKEDTWKK